MSFHTETPGALWKNALELMDRRRKETDQKEGEQ